MIVMVAASAQAAEAKVVSLEIDLDDGATLEDTVRELLGRIGITVGKGSEVLARVRVEKTDGGARVIVKDGRGDTSLTRDIPRGESPALFRETIAHVILGAVEPLAEEPAGKKEKREEPPPPPPPPPPKDERRSEITIALGARGSGTLVAPGQLGASFGGGLGLTWSAPLRPSALIGGGYFVPMRLRDHGLEAELTILPVRAAFRVEPIASSSFALGFAAGGGVDVVSLAPRAGDGLRLAPGSTRVQPMLGGWIEARLILGARFDLVLALGLDVDLAPRRWVIDTGFQQRAPFAEVGRVRPFLSIGFDAAVLGGR
jgi:hypothetical protein